MRPLVDLWLRRHRLRRLGRRWTDLWEHRRKLIAELAPGKSFIDVGGMWTIHGEVSFLAEEAGATKVVIVDGMDPTEEFRAKCADRDSRVEYVQGDLHDPQLVEKVGTFDTVWCAGVVYHSPNPYLLIEHLRLMTTGHLLLGSHVIPEIPGFEQACLFYPGISESTQRAFASAHGDKAPSLIGMATPVERAPTMGYVNFWWGLTPSALRAMLDMARFDVSDEWFASPFLMDLLARPRPGESVIPPVEFARERGEARLAREPG